MVGAGGSLRWLGVRLHHGQQAVVDIVRGRVQFADLFRFVRTYIATKALFANLWRRC